MAVTGSKQDQFIDNAIMRLQNYSRDEYGSREYLFMLMTEIGMLAEYSVDRNLCYDRSVHLEEVVAICMKWQEHLDNKERE